MAPVAGQLGSTNGYNGNDRANPTWRDKATMSKRFNDDPISTPVRRYSPSRLQQY